VTRICSVCGGLNHNELVWVDKVDDNNRIGHPLQVPLCQECRRMIRPIVFGYKKIVVVW
jgi:hypothetical protein